MGMFGIKPAQIGDRKCDCSACLQLRQVSIGARVGQGLAVATVVLLGLGGVVLTLSLILWGIVAVVRQL